MDVSLIVADPHLNTLFLAFLRRYRFINGPADDLSISFAIELEVLLWKARCVVVVIGLTRCDD